MKRFKYSIVLGLITTFALIAYMYFTQKKDYDVLIVMAVFLFIFMTLFSYFKMFSHIKNTEIKFQKIKQIIYSGRANHFLNGITVGGTLYVLKDKFVFQTNLLNFLHKHECEVFLKDIIHIDFKKDFGIVNYTLTLTTADNLNERFVVTNTDFWEKEIERVRLTLV